MSLCNKFQPQLPGAVLYCLRDGSTFKFVRGRPYPHLIFISLALGGSGGFSPDLCGVEVGVLSPSCGFWAWEEASLQWGS